MALEEKGDNNSNTLSEFFSTKGLFHKYPYITLDDLMSDEVNALKEVFPALCRYTEASYTKENTDFLSDLHQLKDKAWEPEEADRIRAQYINGGAPSMINISAPQQRAVLRQNRESYDIFCDAANEIRTVIASDITPRFLAKHPEFNDRLETLNQANALLALLNQAKVLKARWDSLLGNYREIIPKNNSRFFSQPKADIDKELDKLKHDFIKSLKVNPHSPSTDLNKLREKLSRNKRSDFEACRRILEALETLASSQEAKNHAKANAFKNIATQTSLLKETIAHLEKMAPKEQLQRRVPRI